MVQTWAEKRQRVRPNRRVLPGLVTTGYLCRLFNRSSLTVNNWRRYEGMPYVEIPGDGRASIRYELSAVLKWAQENGKSVEGRIAREGLNTDRGDEDDGQPLSRDGEGTG